MVTPMARIAHTVEEKPETSPERMTVAGPVWDCLAMSLTGLWSPVAYSVRRKMTTERTMPMVVATASRMSPAMAPARTKKPTMETAAEMPKERMMAFMPSLISVLPFALTVKIPKIEVPTPKALTARGKRTPGSPKVTPPKIRAATKVTS
ncbi:MAG: hypothetical protein UX67_C0025G0002 [Candidatus Woesebacteria bacterium GW2011_GWF2_46_8]|uniref:Uncharacterized protein n=1 Tax=Candidatus Woesebacteria bacterium GW2011_GWF2_46_8 TaxID=1618604 RepID=A0A0G1QSI1_9BACT|nr:MAG: hypothetical protein UX67_C0025G0002 [Candidatus Woesebacteria bacterium GW2011_GWF2_46_8]